MADRVLIRAIKGGNVKRVDRRSADILVKLKKAVYVTEAKPPRRDRASTGRSPRTRAIGSPESPGVEPRRTGEPPTGEPPREPAERTGDETKVEDDEPQRGDRSREYVRRDLVPEP